MLVEEDVTGHLHVDNCLTQGTQMQKYFDGSAQTSDTRKDS